jgi:hypothetical protein
MGIASAIIDNEWLTLLVVATVIFCCVAFCVLRGRVMRAVAAKWDSPLRRGTLEQSPSN